MKRFRHISCVLTCLLLSTRLFAYQISSLTATCKNGQVFLTWKNPGATNLKYRVYRSASKIIASSQLTTSALVGYVMDNSAKNIRKSNLKNSSIYFTIDPATGPLPSNQGLYVVTCSDGQTWYYAVTVEDLLTHKESKNISPGKNSLSSGVHEAIAPVQPVLQSTVNDNSGDIDYEYVVWGNNQTTGSLPAFNNCGSYGYNFTYVSHTSGNDPLYVLFRDDDPFSHIAAPEQCGQCNSLLMDDWLPNESNTNWYGYNENYNIYSIINPVMTTGTVRSYTQVRVKWMIDWVVKNQQLDSTRIYCSGFSHNGFGTMLFCMVHPEMIAASWSTVSPPLMKALKGSDREKIWCSNLLNLLTDVNDPTSGLPMNIWDLFDCRRMYCINNDRGIPYMGGVNGKNDITVGWVQYYYWYDSVNISHQGGSWFWDQRTHSGNGKNFTDEEASIDYERFSTTKSYPAFAYCSINQNPGNGDPANGDDYGALNGYLDWDDNSINDAECSYSIKVMVKDMYVNGVMQQQYDSCTSDITLRRLQNFHPTIGATLLWNIRNANNQTIQSGSIIYDGSPITLYGIKILRSGTTVSLRIQNCFGKAEEESASSSDPLEVQFLKSPHGYTVVINLISAGEVRVTLCDLTGRIYGSDDFEMSAGKNEFKINVERGVYLIQIMSGKNRVWQKLIF